MRRLAGSRLGAVVSLSLVLGVGAVVGQPATAVEPTVGDQQHARSAPTQVADEGDAPVAKVRRVSAARATLPPPRSTSHAPSTARPRCVCSAPRSTKPPPSTRWTPTSWSRCCAMTPRRGWTRRGRCSSRTSPPRTGLRDPCRPPAPLDQTFPLHSKAGLEAHHLPRLRRRCGRCTRVARGLPRAPHEPARLGPVRQRRGVRRHRADQRSRRSGRRWPRTTRRSTSTSRPPTPARPRSTGRTRPTTSTARTS